MTEETSGTAEKEKGRDNRNDRKGKRKRHQERQKKKKEETTGTAEREKGRDRGIREKKTSENVRKQRYRRLVPNYIYLTGD